MNVKTSNIIVLLISFVTILVFTRCEQEETLQVDKFSTIAMPQAQSSPNKHSVSIVDTSQTLIYSASYQGAKPAENDISIQFRVEPALADSFNANNVVSYPMLPEGSYELSQKSATIPAGKRSTGNLKIKLKTAGYIKARGKQYLLPVTMNVKNSGVPVNKNLKTTYFLIQGRYVNIDKSDWKLIDFDSQEPGRSDFAASNVIDGDESTVWNTQYSSPRPGPPHHITVDMGESHTINGFRIFGRSQYLNQNPKNVTIQFSDDGTTWRDGETFSLPFNEQDKYTTKVYLSNSAEARYFKFIINRDVEKGHKPMNMNEIIAF